MQVVALSDFQNRCIVLLKQIEASGESVLITDNNQPLARIVHCKKSSTEQQTQELLAMLRGNVQRYTAPEDSVGETDWQAWLDLVEQARIQYSSSIFRFLGFFDNGNLVILNHAFQKKSQKTPNSDIEIAEARKHDYLARKKTR